MKPGTLLILMIGLLLSTGVTAENVQSEADKARRLQALLGQQPVFPYEGVKAKDRPFCEGFLEALKSASPNIAYIEPVLRTDDPLHPGLSRYEACYRREGGRGESSFTLCAVGERRFRLYRVELDGNMKNGPEEYLYGQEPSCNQRSPTASYARVDFNTYDACDLYDLLAVAPENPIDKRSYSDGSINALVRYRDRYFIIDFVSYEEAAFTINLMAYDKAKKSFAGRTYCSWESTKVRNDIQGGKK